MNFENNILSKHQKKGEIMLNLKVFKKNCLVIIFLTVVLSFAYVTMHVDISSGKEWSNKVIKLVVPASPGSSIDRLSRGAYKFLSKKIDAPIVVVNKPGGAFIVGTKYMLGMPNDGNALLCMVMPQWNVALHRGKMKVEDFAYLGGFNVDLGIIVTQPNSKISNFEIMVNEMKNKPGKVLYSVTPGAPSHMGILYILNKLGIPAPRIVAYSSGGKRRADFLGGHHDLAAETVDAFMPYYPDKMKPIVILNDTRSAKIPDVPTANEALLKMGISNVKVPSLAAMRFYATSKETKEKFPKRWAKLQDSFKWVAHNKDFLAWAKKAGFEISWLTEKETYERIKVTSKILAQFPEILQEK